MTRSKFQQVKDALYYFKKPEPDILKGVGILEDIVPKDVVAKIIKIPTASKNALNLTQLKGIKLCLWVGHQPGGGAQGERAWNIKLAKTNKAMVEANGGECRVYYHKLAAYGARQDAMRARMLKDIEAGWKADLCLELHYDAVKRESASGYHFQYRGFKQAAIYFRDRFGAAFPNKRRHRDNGILHNVRGNGAGFLKKCPVPAILCEPLFRSSPTEWAFFKDKHEEVATAYLLACADFAQPRLQAAA